MAEEEEKTFTFLPLPLPLLDQAARRLRHSVYESPRITTACSHREPRVAIAVWRMRFAQVSMNMERAQ
eukprot:5282561-Pleurochrysis_carterae.AAC.1